MIRPFLIAALKAIGGLALGSVVLWQVAIHSGPPNGIAYVHVSAPGVELLVDDLGYQVESLQDSPITCELRPGKHSLRMEQNGKILFTDEFTLRSGDEVVLTAWDRSQNTASRPMPREHGSGHQSPSREIARGTAPIQGQPDKAYMASANGG
jgi:hypothetical protein